MNKDAAKKKLIVLYQEIADHTEPECRLTCFRPHSCCSLEYCIFTIEYAKEEWGVELPATDHPKLPLMGEKGCTAAPHLRPACALHTCEIASMGWKDGDPEWTDKYFKIRNEIDTVHFELETQKGKPND